MSAKNELKSVLEAESISIRRLSRESGISPRVLMKVGVSKRLLAPKMKEKLVTAVNRAAQAGGAKKGSYEISDIFPA